MRGTVTETDEIKSFERITPAHAGNRLSVPASTALKRDHPRTCGEQLALVASHATYVGSPPHMRGTDTA